MTLSYQTSTNHEANVMPVGEGLQSAFIALGIASRRKVIANNVLIRTSGMCEVAIAAVEAQAIQTKFPGSILDNDFLNPSFY